MVLFATHSMAIFHPRRNKGNKNVMKKPSFLCLSLGTSATTDLLESFCRPPSIKLLLASLRKRVYRRSDRKRYIMLRRIKDFMTAISIFPVALNYHQCAIGPSGAGRSPFFSLSTRSNILQVHSVILKG